MPSFTYILTKTTVVFLNLSKWGWYELQISHNHLLRKYLYTYHPSPSYLTLHCIIKAAETVSVDNLRINQVAELKGSTALFKNPFNSTGGDTHSCLTGERAKRENSVTRLQCQSLCVLFYAVESWTCYSQVHNKQPSAVSCLATVSNFLIITDISFRSGIN